MGNGPWACWVTLGQGELFPRWTSGDRHALSLPGIKTPNRRAVLSWCRNPILDPDARKRLEPFPFLGCKFCKVFGAAERDPAWESVAATRSRKETPSEGQCRSWSAAHYTGGPKAESPLSQGPRPLFVKTLYTLSVRAQTHLPISPETSQNKGKGKIQSKFTGDSYALSLGG